jgi:hypothetical protein
MAQANGNGNAAAPRSPPLFDVGDIDLDALPPADDIAFELDAPAMAHGPGGMPVGAGQLVAGPVAAGENAAVSVAADVADGVPAHGSSMARLTTRRLPVIDGTVLNYTVPGNAEQCGVDMDLALFRPGPHPRGEHWLANATCPPTADEEACVRNFDTYVASLRQRAP